MLTERIRSDADTGSVSARVLFRSLTTASGPVSPRHAEVRRLLGEGQPAAALRTLELIADEQPRDLAVWHDLGDAFHILGKQENAITAYERALALDPRRAEILEAIGVARLCQGEASLAADAFRYAVSIEPNAARIHSHLLHALTMDPATARTDLFAETLAWADRHASPWRDVERPMPTASRERRLVVGFLVPGYRNRAVLQGLRRLLMALDRDLFDPRLYATAGGIGSLGSDLTALAHATDLGGIDDGLAFRVLRGHRIDVLVDLAGHAAGGRPLLVARRPAPLQVAWGGYNASIGLSAIDGRLVDRRITGEGFFEPTLEPIVALAGPASTFVVPDASIDTARAGGPPASGPAFGYFGDVARIGDATVSNWSWVMAAIPSATLVIGAPALAEPAACSRILNRLDRAGIEPSRISLTPLDAGADNRLRAYGSVDIALDSAWSADATTTIEALWMGVPVLTVEGNMTLGRSTSAVLRHLGLDDLIARDDGDLMRVAAGLVESPRRLSHLRAGLRGRVARSVLMDAPASARSFEQAIQTLWRRRVTAP